MGSSFIQAVAREVRALRGSLHRRVARFDPHGDVTRAFHLEYFNARQFDMTWRNTHWMGHAILKCPLDLWLYQEILHKVRPAVIIETGTAFGGSALYLAMMCDLLGSGRVITIDITDRPGRPVHPRIQYVSASSTAPDTLSLVAREIAGQGPVMVILDSDHRMEHVREELELYHPFVSVGSYLVVEDTNLNGHPVEPEHGPGPMEAMRAFLPAHPEFAHDTEMDKFLLTFNPKGFLRRLS